MSLRPELTPLPELMRHLPVDKRGWVIPYFVAWVNGEPEFRAMDPAKWKRCARERLCWVCGQKLGSYLAFTLGPMCTITRTTPEPPSHRVCAEWSAINCPFLSRPHMVRREDELVNTESAKNNVAGEMIARNPGAVAVWITRSYKIWHDGRNKPLITVGDPEEVRWYAQGRPATREEVEESIRTGLPLLEATCEGNAQCLKDLAERHRAMLHLLPPAEVPA